VKSPEIGRDLLDYIARHHVTFKTKHMVDRDRAVFMAALHSSECFYLFIQLQPSVMLSICCVRSCRLHVFLPRVYWLQPKLEFNPVFCVCICTL